MVLAEQPQTLILQCKIKTDQNGNIFQDWAYTIFGLIQLFLFSFTGVIKCWLFAEFLYCGELRSFLSALIFIGF